MAKFSGEQGNGNKDKRAILWNRVNKGNKGTGTILHLWKGLSSL